MDSRVDEKKQRLLAALDRGMAMIHLDARRPGVLVPDHLKSELHLLLNLSYRFDPPDLSVGEWGIRSTLTFSGKRFTVAVPWSALYAISSHVTKEFWMFADDMPPELLERAQLTTKVPVSEVSPRAPVEKLRGPRAVLRGVDGGLCDSAPEPPKEDPPRPSGRGHLRLVK